MLSLDDKHGKMLEKGHRRIMSKTTGKVCRRTDRHEGVAIGSNAEAESDEAQLETIRQVITNKNNTCFFISIIFRRNQRLDYFFWVCFL